MAMPVPAMWHGQLFPSIAALARHLGLSEATVHWHLNNYGHAEFMHVGGIRRSPTSVEGRTFPSLNAARLAMDTTFHRAKRQLGADGTLDRLAQTLKRERGLPLDEPLPLI